MAGDRSFADYVQEKLYNRIYKSVEEFVELNWERLDLDISNVHNVGEVDMSNMEIQFVSVGDLPDLKIEFDVVVDAEIEITEGDYHYDEYDINNKWLTVKCIGDIKQETDKKWTLHDPAAGSGSLLIRAADEAPTDENGDSIVTIYGQEKYPDTAGLAKMNFILHNKGTGEIKSGNTLANPQYEDDFGGLRKFDFIVIPPFQIRIGLMD